MPPEADIEAEIDINDIEFYDNAEHGVMNELQIRAAGNRAREAVVRNFF